MQDFYLQLEYFFSHCGTATFTQVKDLTPSLIIMLQCCPHNRWEQAFLVLKSHYSNYNHRVLLEHVSDCMYCINQTTGSFVAASQTQHLFKKVTLPSFNRESAEQIRLLPLV